MIKATMGWLPKYLTYHIVPPKALIPLRPSAFCLCETALLNQAPEEEKLGALACFKLAPRKISTIHECSPPKVCFPESGLPPMENKRISAPGTSAPPGSSEHGKAGRVGRTRGRTNLAIVEFRDQDPKASLDERLCSKSPPKLGSGS